MENKIDIALNEIIDKISNLPQGSEFRIGDYLKDYNFTNEENMELTKKVIGTCKEKNIILENTQENMILGMPWVFILKKMN